MSLHKKDETYYREPPSYFGLGMCSCGTNDDTKTTNEQYNMLPKQRKKDHQHHHQRRPNEESNENFAIEETDILEGTSEKEDLKSHLRQYDFEAAHPFSSRNTLSALKISQQNNQSNYMQSPTQSLAAVRRHSSTSTPQIPRVFAQDSKSPSHLLRKSSLINQSKANLLDQSHAGLPAAGGAAESMTSSNEIVSSHGRIETYMPEKHGVAAQQSQAQYIIAESHSYQTPSNTLMQKLLKQQQLDNSQESLVQVQQQQHYHPDISQKAIRSSVQTFAQVQPSSKNQFTPVNLNPHSNSQSYLSQKIHHERSMDNLGDFSHSFNEDNSISPTHQTPNPTISPNIASTVYYRSMPQQSNQQQQQQQQLQNGHLQKHRDDLPTDKLINYFPSTLNRIESNTRIREGEEENLSDLEITHEYSTIKTPNHQNQSYLKSGVGSITAIPSRDHIDEQHHHMHSAATAPAPPISAASQTSQILAKIKVIQNPLPLQSALFSQQASETPRGAQSSSSRVYLNSQHFHDFNTHMNAGSLASSIEAKKDHQQLQNNTELYSVPEIGSNNNGRWSKQLQHQITPINTSGLAVGAGPPTNSTPLAWIAKRSNSLFKYEEVLEEQEEIIPDDEHKHQVNLSGVRSSPQRKSVNTSPLRQSQQQDSPASQSLDNSQKILSKQLPNQSIYSNSHQKQTISFDRTRPISLLPDSADHAILIESAPSTKTIDDIIDEKIKRNKAESIPSTSVTSAPPEYLKQQLLPHNPQFHPSAQQQMSFYPPVYPMPYNHPMMMPYSRIPFEQQYYPLPLGYTPNPYPMQGYPPQFSGYPPYPPQFAFPPNSTTATAQQINDFYHYNYLPQPIQANPQASQSINQLNNKSTTIENSNQNTSKQQVGSTQKLGGEQLQNNDEEVQEIEELIQDNTEFDVQIPRKQEREQAVVREANGSVTSSNQNMHYLSASFGAPPLHAESRLTSEGILVLLDDQPAQETLQPGDGYTSSVEEPGYQSPGSPQVFIRSTKSSELKQKTTTEKLRVMNETALEKKMRVAAKLEELRIKEEEMAQDSQIKRQNQLLKQQNQQLKQQNLLLRSQMSPTSSSSMIQVSSPVTAHQSQQQQHLQTHPQHQNDREYATQANTFTSQDSSQALFSPRQSPKSTSGGQLNNTHSSNNYNIRAIDLSSALKGQNNGSKGEHNNRSGQQKQQQSQSTHYNNNYLSSSQSSTKENNGTRVQSPSLKNQPMRQNEEQLSSSVETNSLSSLKDSSQPRDSIKPLKLSFVPRSEPNGNILAQSQPSDYIELSSKINHIAANITNKKVESKQLAGEEAMANQKLKEHTRSTSNNLSYSNVQSRTPQKQQQGGTQVLNKVKSSASVHQNESSRKKITLSLHKPGVAAAPFTSSLTPAYVQSPDLHKRSNSQKRNYQNTAATTAGQKSQSEKVSTAQLQKKDQFNLQLKKPDAADTNTMKAVNKATNSVFEQIEHCYSDLRTVYDGKHRA